MLVRTGINSDYARKKLDVELDDTHDLASILAEAGLPPDFQLTNWVKFNLLYVEAQIMAWTAAADMGIVEPAEATPKVGDLHVRKQQWLVSVLPQSEHPA